MLKNTKHILKSTFFKNVAVLASGTIIGQVAPILFSPILSRLFSPEEFGTLAILLAIVASISNISMARYEFAIVLPKNDRQAVNIVALSGTILLFVTIISLLVILFFRSDICILFNEPALYNWLLVVPFYILIQGIWRILNYWSTRKGLFKKIAIGGVLRTYGNSLISIGLGLSQITKISGLIVGAVVGQFVESLFLLLKSGRVLKVAVRAIKKSLLKEYAFRYRRFLLIDTPHVIIDNVNNQGSPFIIAYFFSKQTLGYYSFMMRILRLPVSLVGSAFSQVFYRTIAEKHANGQSIHHFIKKIIILLALIGFVPALILFLYGAPLFSFVFGEKWIIAGEYASILSLYMFSHFIVSSLSFVPYVIGKMKFDFIFSTICNILFVMLFVIGATIFDDFKLSLILISSLISILYWGYLFWILKVSK